MRWLLLVSVALFASSAFAADLDGRVLNAITGLPLRHAVVHLSDERSVETDGEGRFVFLGLDAGQYLLKASRDGFLTQGYGPRRFVPTPISLSGDEHRRDLVIRLTPASVISGRIVDEDGEPVMDLEVFALRAESRHGRRELVEVASGITTDLGEYRIAKLEPGGYLVKTRPRQPVGDTLYAAAFYPGTEDESGAVAVRVPAGGEARGIDIALKPAKGFHIRGKVVKPPGTAAVLALERNGGYRQIVTNMTATESGFELHGMTPGRYTIYVEPEDSDWHGGGRQAVDVIAKNVDGLVIAITGATDIPGRIRVGDATTPLDLKKLTIEAHTSAINFPEPAAVENAGFVLKNMVASRFGVAVTGLPENCFVKSILYGGVEILNADSEVNGSLLEIILSATAGVIDGKVTGKDGKALPGSTAVLLDSGGAVVASVVTDSSGAFRFVSLHPGDYKVLAVDDMTPGAVPDPESIRHLAAHTEAVTVEPNGHAAVEVKTEVDPG